MLNELPKSTTKPKISKIYAANNQVNDALKHVVRPLVKVIMLSQREDEESKIGMLHAEDDRALDEVVNDESTEGIVRPIVASNEPRKILTARCI